LRLLKAIVYDQDTITPATRQNLVCEGSTNRLKRHTGHNELKRSIGDLKRYAMIFFIVADHHAASEQ